MLMAVIGVITLQAKDDKSQPVAVYQNQVQSYSEASSRNLEPVITAVAVPVIVDVKVTGKRISYTETEAFKDITVTAAIQNYGDQFATEGIAAFKRIALAQAAAHYNVDIIFGATFNVVTTADNHFSITVAGYPAVYSNFRNATKADADLLETYEKYMPNVNYDPLLNTPVTTIKSNEVIVTK